MFEKEAEEYANNTRIKDKNTYISFPYESISEVQDFEGNYIDISERIIKTFKDASEFGYNKATEWHYPSKGEYPKTKKKVLVQLKDVDEPILDYYRQDGLWNYALKEEVIAWKEIVLPKKSE